MGVDEREFKGREKKGRQSGQIGMATGEMKWRRYEAGRG